MKPTRLDLLREMLESYRDRLMMADPVACGDLDARWVEAGQPWIGSTEIVNLADLKTAREIWEMMGPGFEPENIRQWIGDKSTGVRRHGYRGRTPLLLVGEVLAYQASLRR